MLPSTGGNSTYLYFRMKWVSATLSKERINNGRSKRCGILAAVFFNPKIKTINFASLKLLRRLWLELVRVIQGRKMYCCCPEPFWPFTHLLLTGLRLTNRSRQSSPLLSNALVRSLPFIYLKRSWLISKMTYQTTTNLTQIRMYPVQWKRWGVNDLEQVWLKSRAFLFLNLGWSFCWATWSNSEFRPLSPSSANRALTVRFTAASWEILGVKNWKEKQ